MNSAIAVFFASLVSGALSFADFRPALSDMVHILTGVQITQQATLETNQETVCSTDSKAEEERLSIYSDTSKRKAAPCKETAYDQGRIYVL